jgi:hypothetical protein
MLYFRGGGSAWALEDKHKYAGRMLEMIRVMKGYEA